MSVPYSPMAARLSLFTLQKAAGQAVQHESPAASSANPSNKGLARTPAPRVVVALDRTSRGERGDRRSRIEPQRGFARHRTFPYSEGREDQPNTPRKLQLAASIVSPKRRRPRPPFRERFDLP